MVLAEKQNHSDSISNENLIDSVANVLGIKDAKSIINRQSLTEFGMDSLMCTEIKELLERNFNYVITSREIRELTFAQLEMMEQSSSNAI